jgi:hypothetical protein
MWVGGGAAPSVTSPSSCNTVGQKMSSMFAASAKTVVTNIHITTRNKHDLRWTNRFIKKPHLHHVER